MFRHFVIAAALLAPAAAWAEPAMPAQTEVMAAETRWMDAMKRKDAAALEQVVAPEFTLGGVGEPDRPAVPRSVWIDNTLHHLEVSSVSFGQTRVSVFGDTATVVAVFSWKGAYDGEAFTDTIPLVDTWVRRDGRWRVVQRLVGDLCPHPN